MTSTTRTTTTTRTGAPGGERFEAVVQIAIMLIIGTTAGAASFTHVHDVAYTHGQPDWIGWADACVVELMSLALGLELRRRARTTRPTGFVLAALVFFIAVSLAAQVVEAEPSLIGWLAAALPALGFLVLAKVVLSRTTTGHTTPVATPTVAASTAAPATYPAGPVHHEPRTNMPTATPVESPLPAHLLNPARFAATNHRQSTGQTITASQLATRLSITPDLAGRLLAALDLPAPAIPGSTPADSAAAERQINGASLALRSTP